MTAATGGHRHKRTQWPSVDRRSPLLPLSSWLLSRCEVIAYLDNTPTTVASGLVKPYASHIRAVEEQLESGSHLILLDPRAVEESAFCPWFNLRTIRR